jgi:DNA-directed RNA polymerase specialized sigma24 family protein
MTTKEYLSQAFRLDQKINSKLEQVSRLRDLATKATASIHAERVSGTRDRSPLENAVVKLVDLEREIDKDIDKLVEFKRELAKLMKKVKTPNHRLLLELRYINGFNWSQISEALDYDLRYIHKLHNKALIECKEILES